ncbi:MAG TPA: hypothetical protein VGQ78_00510 [Vicinamibacteria bacterium]|jgi:hypothetical protein|nr:hypothetical protein [Vicinamibacteria bacterium]
MLTLALMLVAAAPLPAEIQEHYRDFSFVSAFSTAQERRLIAGERAQPPSTSRLARIARTMERLSARILDTDPGIMGGRRTLPESAYRSELLRIRSFRLDDARGEAWVELEALRLEPASDVTLIARFDELAPPGRQPTTEELLATGGRTRVETVEVHHWIRVGGHWRREAAVRQFVDFEKQR